MPNNPFFRKVRLPSNQNENCPDLYEVPNHPLNPRKDGRSYFFYQDTSKLGMLKILARERLIKIPTGDRRRFKSLGFFELVDGDHLFSRSTKNGTSDTGLNDILQAWVTETGELELRQAMDWAALAALGPRDERTNTMPTWDGSEYHGGTTFERNMRAKSVEDGRCYTLVNSLERHPGIVAPCASSKVMGEFDEALVLRRELIQASSAVAMAAFQHAGSEVVQNTRNHAELINLPRFGVEDNYAYATQQINFSGAQVHTDMGDAALKDMGQFGVTHDDGGDNPRYLGCATSRGDMPEEYFPGAFFLTYAGVFTVMSNHISINFSG